MEFEDKEVSVHNESTKRDVAEAPDKDKKSAKKRRSSLATTRRSITGDIFAYDIGMNSSSEGSHKTADASNSTESRLQPNPANLRMDEIIHKLNAKIKVLDEEYAQWKQELRAWDERESNAKLLSESITPISDHSIPEEIKALASKEFITCGTLDLPGLEKRLERRLFQLYMDMSSCTRDLHLFRETVDGVQCANQLMRRDLSSSLTASGDAELRDGRLGNGSDEQHGVKSHIENLINSA